MFLNPLKTTLGSTMEKFTEISLKKSSRTVEVCVRQCEFLEPETSQTNQMQMLTHQTSKGMFGHRLVVLDRLRHIVVEVLFEIRAAWLLGEDLNQVSPKSFTARISEQTHSHNQPNGRKR